MHPLLHPRPRHRRRRVGRSKQSRDDPWSLEAFVRLHLRGFSDFQRSRSRGKNNFEDLLHDVSVMPKAAPRARAARSDTVIFRMIVGRRHQALKLHVGPVADGEAVLTLMLPDED